MRKPITRIKRTYLALALIVPIAGSLFVSCKKGAPSWDTNVLAPIIYTNLSMNNLVADSLVKRNPADSSLSLVYNGTIFNLNTDTLIKLPDTTVTNSFAIFSATYTPGQALPLPAITPSTYNLSAVELKKATVKQGFIIIQVQSGLSEPIDLTYNIPSATLNGNPFSATIKVPAGTYSNPAIATDTFSVADYNLDLSGPTHNSFNTLSSTATAEVDPNAPGPLVISGAEGGQINVTFYNIQPSYARGYFGTQTKSYTSQANFPLFSRVVAGSLNLNSISVNMSLANYFGLDAQVNLSQLASYNSNTNTTVNLNAPNIINNTININRATETGIPSNPVVPSVQTFTISPASALLWVDNLPNIVKYSLTATTDPLGNVSGYNDFAYAGPGIESNLNISIPLNLIATNLTLEDTLNVNFATGGNQAKNVKSGTFTLYADNGFPFSAGMQVYLLDSLYRITDSLMVAGPQTIAAGNMNPNGIVTSPVTSVLNMVLNSGRMQNLLKAKHIIVYSRFNMGCLSCLPPQYRKIYSYNLLSIKLVGNFDYQING